MVGRVIALAVAVLAVGVFVWGYQPTYGETWQRTLRALGLAEGYERVQPYYQEQPGPRTAEAGQQAQD